ncbi:MAG: alpha/beta fold hydrolase [Fusobacteria bacterium]|nr:alpha/beta fold hydrolase [Fusobacteriota bacterium]
MICQHYFKKMHRSLNIEISESKNGGNIVLFLHGFLGDISSSKSFDVLSLMLTSQGFSTFRFDFSGCGKSIKKEVSLDIWREDLEAVLDYIESLNYQKIHIVAYSLGSLILLTLLRSKSYYSKFIYKSVFINPVTNKIAYSWESRYNRGRLNELEKLGYMEILTQVQIIRLDKSYFSERMEINQHALACVVGFPLSILHAREDERVPLEDTMRFSEMSPLISVEIIENCTHSFETKVLEVGECIIQFLRG